MPVYDVHFQIVSQDAFERGTTKFFSFGQRSTVGVSGLQKLVNIYAKHLTTPVGSDPIDPAYGTQLPLLLGANVDPIDAYDVLALAVDATTTFVQQIQRGRAVPLDEKLSSATISAYVPIPEAPGFAAQIHIINVANQGLKFNLPTLTVVSS